VQPLGFDGELIGTLVPKVMPRFVREQIGRRAYGFFLQTEDASHAANRVFDSAEASLPVMDYDELRSPASAREHREFTRAFQLALAKAGFVSFTRRIGLSGTAHACGTLRAGHDSSDSVVDAEGRVHGMQGLYVVDGSILPRSSRVNPSLSIYAWGLRVGDRVSRQFLQEASLSTREVAHAN
jgi:choline dehydrogenase-like flavoprotein